MAESEADTGPSNPNPELELMIEKLRSENTALKNNET